MMNKYYEKCLSELESASSHDELLHAWHSFDFDRLTWDERSDLEQRFYEIRDNLRGYHNNLDTDYDLADFCKGGELKDDD